MKVEMIAWKASAVMASFPTPWEGLEEVVVDVAMGEEVEGLSEEMLYPLVTQVLGKEAYLLFQILLLLLKMNLMMKQMALYLYSLMVVCAPISVYQTSAK